MQVSWRFRVESGREEEEAVGGDLPLPEVVANHSQGEQGPDRGEELCEQGNHLRCQGSVPPPHPQLCLLTFLSQKEKRYFSSNPAHPGGRLVDAKGRQKSQFIHLSESENCVCQSNCFLQCSVALLLPPNCVSSSELSSLLFLLPPGLLWKAAKCAGT